MQAKTRGLTHTPPNPPTLGDFELAFMVWSKPRVLLPPKLGGWGGHLRANLNFSKSVHHEHLHAENDRAYQLHLANKEDVKASLRRSLEQATSG
jgi:hypothetical protein